MDLIDSKLLGASSAFKKMFDDVFRYVGDEVKDMFRIGLSEYIDDKYSKVSQIKTFIFKEKRQFNDIYFPLTLSNSKNRFSSDQMFNFLFKDSNTCAFIGGAGSGKTMLMKYAFLTNCITWERIPIYIEFRDLNNFDINFLDYVYKTVLNNKINPSTKILNRALDEGRFIFILDGYDEISFNKLEKISLEIEQFIDQYPQNRFLFSSRPGTNIESFPRLIYYNVNPLSRSEVDSFVERQLRGTEDEDIINSLKDTISKPENKAYLGYVTNPLLLSMFILTYKVFPELPKSRSKFYWNVFDTLCTRHDSTTKKGAYSHEKKTKLQSEDFESILKIFCFYSLSQNIFSFSRDYLYSTLLDIKNDYGYTYVVDDLIYDLVVSISILTEDGLEYKFPHRTLQDYFAILFIKGQKDEIKKEILAVDDVSSRFQFGILTNKELFNLFLEMDKIAFLEYFVIPRLKEFSDKYSIGDLRTKTVNLIIDASITMALKFDSNDKILLITRISRKVLGFLEVGKMYGIRFPIFDGSINAQIKVEDNFISEISDILKRKENGKDSISIIPSRKNEQDIRLVLDLINDDEKFENYFSEMGKLYSNFKDEIQSDSRRSSSILKLIKNKI